jgi:ribosomal protein L37AE/L43A
MWVIGQLAIDQGFRLPEVKELELKPRCGRCNQSMSGRQSFRGGKWVCMKCDEEITAEIRRPYVAISPATTSAIKSVRHAIQGNLPSNDMYRYLIGSPMPISKRWVCRCCMKSIYQGVKEWKDHVGRSCDDDPVNIGNKYGLPHTSRLVNAYKILLNKKDCVVCGKDAHGKEKFGLPLCSDRCVGDWKFEDRNWPSVRDALVEEAKLRAQYANSQTKS